MNPALEGLRIFPVPGVFVDGGESDEHGAPIKQKARAIAVELVPEIDPRYGPASHLAVPDVDRRNALLAGLARIDAIADEHRIELAIDDRRGFDPYDRRPVGKSNHYRFRLRVQIRPSGRVPRAKVEIERIA